MGREKLAVHDERVRENVLAGLDAAHAVIAAMPAVAKGAPWAILVAWSFREFRAPVTTPLESAARAEFVKRMSTVSTPFWTILGALYQGAQGAFIGTILGSLESLVGATQLLPIKNEHGVIVAWQLELLDALFLASMVPLILQSVRGSDVESGGLLP